MKIKVLAMAVLGLTLSCTAQTNKKMSDAYAMAVIPEPAEGQEVAVLASGCFWGTEYTKKYLASRQRPAAILVVW